MGRDEITAPPGTVPRRVPQLQKQTSVVPRKSLTSVSRLASLSAESVCVPDRPTSISSQQTFVLENDRRRPLVARNAFQSAAINSPSVAPPKPKPNAKDSNNRVTPKMLARGLSEPRALKQSHESVADLCKTNLNGAASKKRQCFLKLKKMTAEEDKPCPRSMHFDTLFS